MEKNIKMNGVLKTVVILSSLLGPDRVYLITTAPLYRIISKLYAGCFVSFTVFFYVHLYLRADSTRLFLNEYISALEYCVLAILKLLRSKDTWIDYFQNISDVDASLKVKGTNVSNNCNNLYFSISCLVQSIILPAIFPILFWLNFNKMIPLPSAIFLLLSMVHDLELIFIGNFMMMVEARILFVNAHLKKRLADSEDQSSEDRMLLEPAKRTELDTHDLYQIYVKVFNCCKILTKYMSFPVTVLMVSSFVITHFTILGFTEHLNANTLDLRVDSNAWMQLFLGVSVLKCIAGLATLGVLGSRTRSAAETVMHVLADVLTDINLERSERRRLKGFQLSCAERPFRYALCRVIPLDATLPVNFVALSVSYLVIGSQFIKLVVAAHSRKSGP